MTRPDHTDDAAPIAVPEQPALSPDGEEIAYVLRVDDRDADRIVRGIWTVGTRHGEPRRLTRGPADTAPAWSPDGRRLAFLRGDDVPQVWTLPRGGGEPEPVTSLPFGAGPPVWSPDGTRLAFTAEADPAAADTPEPPRHPYAIHRLDDPRPRGGRRRHVHVLDTATGHVQRVTDGDWDAGEPAWSPDGARLAFASASAPDADLTTRSPIHVVDLTDPAGGVRTVGLREGSGTRPVWTADGAGLLVTGHLGAPAGLARLLLVPIDGGPATDLTAALDRAVMPGGPAYPGGVARPAGDGRTVVFCARDRGCTHLYATGLGGDSGPRPLIAGDGITVAGLSVAGDTVAVVLGTPSSFGEIAVVDLAAAAGEMTVRTSYTPPDLPLLPRREREFRISDGTVVAGWTIRDPATEGPSPLLLDIHGGPHNAWHAGAEEVHLYHQVLARRGWTILLVNPRGSDGYGEDFYTSAAGAWGEADARDLWEAVDTLVEEGIADPRRLAVTGYSYGGYLTAYLTGRDDRFAAAVAGGMVSDLTSMAGTSAEGPPLTAVEWGGPFWNRPDRYAAMSPLTRVGDVRTPTLMVHGTEDVVTPPGQAHQWHAALRARGVSAELVLYPGGTHTFILDGPPSHRRDWNRRIVDWVERYAGGRSTPIRTEHWRRRLAVLAERHGVPGATLGILRIGAADHEERIEVAHGVLNLDTGVAVTPDSVFQIGSISKVWTATVVMQLADEGLLDLDAPITKVLPELRLADPDTAKGVTMRHLLTHTSGIDGDVFTDTGRGDDAVERYVAGLRDEAQVHPLGATWSYCNSGFVLAGRVIERLTGWTWDEAMRRRLFAPLGLARTGTLPEEALLHRAAVGHVRDGDRLVKAPVWQLPRSVGPAGLISATAGDVLTFARLHLAGGRAPDGATLLSEAAVTEMAAAQVELPDRHTLGDSWGLGWMRTEWDGHRLVGHDGNTIGQSAYLRIVPGAGLAVALLTNAENARDLYEDVYREVFAEIAGIAVPAPLAPPREPVEVSIAAHTGVYERASTRLEVLDTPEGPILRRTVTGPLAELTPEPVTVHPLMPVAENLFVTRLPNSRTWTPVTFYRLAGGERYVHFGVRATPKVS
ncbi:serine hydrolase [Catenuloplanes atrovinosus]|uniref:Acyl-peptide hydrolase n=1 Tax=Catenuloplanes atrovinosus TaxID=137266 RepID=A0AAE4CA53_9ACTN|nr:serine hydrolase [Catenuloplanes atrovinosus]MDR7277271.1 dipeptidyl aminopeptidase/acylaminoacyl peptidase/CubicO group peptidase (beta-lactamase class C family) [Catenuloplanes atrovinosus]